jgi:DtxR family transcriptional regulator, Mn-dependent transcriptional regulator
VQLLGDPATCPHGNPIPGSGHKVDVRGSTPLSRVDPGRVSVSRISEKVELDDDALVLLAGALLTPGSEAIVVGPGPDGVVVKTAAGERTIPTRLAELMFVTPAA